MQRHAKKLVVNNFMYLKRKVGGLIFLGLLISLGIYTLFSSKYVENNVGQTSLSLRVLRDHLFRLKSSTEVFGGVVGFDTSNRGNYVVMAGSSFGKILDVESEEILEFDTQNSKKIENIKLIQEDKNVLFSYLDKNIDIYDIKKQEVIESFNFNNSSVNNHPLSSKNYQLLQSISDVYYSGLTASKPKQGIKVIDTESKSEICSVNEEVYFELKGDISPNQKALVVFGEKRQPGIAFIKVFSLPDCQETAAFPIATSEQSGYKDLYSQKIEDEEWEQDVNHTFLLLNAQIKFSPDNKFLALNIHNQIWIYDLATLKRTRIIGDRPLDTRYKGINDNRLSAIAFSSGGRFITAGSGDCKIKVWNFHTGDLVDEIHDVRYSINKIQFSYDDQFIVSSSFSNPYLRVWKTKLP